jgi:hypothetical protein
VLAAVMDALPAPMQGDLDNLIDQWVAGRTFDSMPVPAYLESVVDRIVAMFGDFRLISIVNMAPPNDRGETRASHTIDAIEFNYGGTPLRVYAPRQMLLSNRAWADGSAAHLGNTNEDIEDARFYLGEHSLSAPVGTLAMLGVNQFSQSTYHNISFRSTLAEIMDCDGMAGAVAEACSGTTCGDLQVAVAAMCVNSLDRTVEQLKERLAELRIGTVEFSAGEAALYDAPTPRGKRDGKIDRIERGRWQLKIARAGGQAEIAATGTFTGNRVGDYEAAHDPIPRRPSPQADELANRDSPVGGDEDGIVY